MEEIYNGNGVFIPYEVLQSKELTSTEKILYAEIYYLDRPDTHCFASNEHLAKFLDISESGVKKCLAHLKSLGYIETVSFDGRTRTLATTVKWSNQIDTPVSSRKLPEYQAEGYKNENLLLIENKKENSIEKPVSPASTKNHRHDFVYKDKQALNHSLDDGDKYIADYEKSKKKSPKEKFIDECLDIIDKEYSGSTKELLTEYFQFVIAPTDVKENVPKRVKSVSSWRKKLDKLDALVKEGYDCNKLIMQSLDKKQYVFYPLQSTQSQHKSKENLSDTIKVNTQEGVQRQIEYLRASGKELY